jgi:hypothetical protein
MSEPSKTENTSRALGLTEEELADFMLQRIESGDLALEDIPARLARYGLMAPEDFVAEMLERMALQAEASL